MSKSDHTSDVKFIAALAALLREHDLSEVEVRRSFGEDDTLDVRVARGTLAAPQMQPAPAPVHHAAAAPAPAAASAVAEAPEDPAQHPGAVTSPMVGTAYLQPEPGAPAFVSVGDKVSEGQTVLIIEAMKTMNQIPAPRAGTVKRILIEDGSPVEFGAPLLILE
ncbi:acetyl-CoA carboxylase biotin carboxyl carrier protein [Rhodobacteraceae bacterium 2CG4]|uniref:Biotin carboxyl carrier protein of acetyl-CoA carboxylase n=1 Tax=Halovulum marinum TaxID=2662447 RepID=A0A6L5YXK4_9RHOB|nr:acetyl-CoA carboxylase biotin carboxyl carrier protein [Halovulum marinum]MSU89061.1 acetyl-CoA carboxylase biotin carboxyl carrier protein [Halovulum marinum]